MKVSRAFLGVVVCFSVQASADDPAHFKHAQEQTQNEETLPTEYRLWTERQGGRKINARLIDYKKGKVHLKTSDDKIIVESSLKFSREDLRYISEIVPKIRAQLPSSTGEEETPPAEPAEFTGKTCELVSNPIVPTVELTELQARVLVLKEFTTLTTPAAVWLEVEEGKAKETDVELRPLDAGALIIVMKHAARVVTIGEIVFLEVPTSQVRKCERLSTAVKLFPKQPRLVDIYINTTNSLVLVAPSSEKVKVLNGIVDPKE